MFEVWSVGMIYRFESNASKFFPSISRQVAKFTGLTDALRESVGLASEEFRAFGSTIRESASFLRRSVESVDGVAGSMDAMGESAAVNARRFVTATSAIGDGAAEAAASVSESTAVMNRRLGGTAAAATRTAAAMNRVGIAGRGRSGGGGGDAGASGAGGDASGGGSRFAGLGGVAGAVGLASALGIGFGVKAAGDVQNAELQTAIATGRMAPTIAGTMRNMRPTEDLAYAMSAMTGGSVRDMMNVIQNQATSGLTMAQIRATADPFARATDILHYGKSQMSFADSSTLLAGLSHDMRLFTAKDMNSAAQTLARGEYASPHKMSELATQIRLFAPKFTGFLPGNRQQVSDEIIMTELLADRMGQMQRSGAGINMLAQYMMHPKTKAQIASMKAFGILDSQGNNRFYDTNTRKFDFYGAIAEAQRSSAKMSGKDFAKYDAPFSQNANRYWDMFLSKDEPGVMARLRKQMANEPTLVQMQSQLMETLPHVIGRLTTNLESLATTLGSPLIEPLTKFARLATATSTLTDYLRAHPRVNAIASGTLATAGLVAGGAFVRSTILPMFGIGGRHVGAAATEAVEHGSSFVSRAAAVTGDMFPLLGKVAANFGALGRTIASIAGPIGRTIGGFSVFGRSIGVLSKGLVPLVGDLWLVTSAVKLLSAHSYDLGYAIGKVARWLHDTGGPMLAKAMEDAFTSAMGYAIKSILPYTRDTILSNIEDVIGVRHKAAGFDATLDAILGGAARGVQAGYGPTAGSSAPQFNPGAIPGNVFVNHGTVNVRANDPRQFHDALTGHGTAQHTSAALGNNPLAFPGSSMTGIGGNGSK